ncbi:MAG: DUF4890 domain-containing protein, partial [Elusimicrobia bacterium]|nr:DUF4890 domain-containing protein [Elusimicrobiota bacterium]
MKRFVLAAFAAALLVPFAGVPTRAQGGPGGGPQGGPPSPEMREKMAAKLKEKLGLTDDQAAKFKEAEKAHFEAMKPVHEKTKELMEKLHKQVEAKAKDDELKATLDALKAQRKTLQDEQEKFHASLQGILTPTQQAKFVLGAAHRMKARMEG